MDNPYRPPETQIAPVITADYVQGTNGGINRLMYFGGAFLVYVIQKIVQLLESGLVSVTAGLALLVYLPLCFYRLKNTGWNGWWCLLSLVPIANLVVGVRCLAYQEGYSVIRRLDTAGKVTIGLLIAFTLMLASVAFIAIWSIQSR